MFKLFKRKRNKTAILSSVLERMTSAVDKQQRKAAHYLNDKVSVFSNRQIKIALLFFCLLSGSCIIYIVWQSIYHPPKAVLISPIQPPAHSLLPKEELPPEIMLSNEELKGIQHFLQYLDSLQQSPSGKTIYDSIARHRSGLLDSLAFIQQFFHEQFKTK